MTNTRTYTELRTHLDEIAYDIGLKKRPDLEAEAEKQAKAYNDAFWLQMKTGEITNALRKGGDVSGGYLVPDTYSGTLVEAIAEDNIFRKLGTVMKTKNGLKIPVSGKMTPAQWVNENEPYIDLNVEFSEIKFDAYKATVSTLVSDELLEDSEINIEKHLTESFGKAIGLLEEEAFLSGDGNGKPLGIIHQAKTGVERADINITVGDIIDLYHSLRMPYRNNAVWLMSDEAYMRLRKIRVYNGRPVWQASIEDDEPETLLGRPVYICKSMDIVAPGNIPVMFGDFKYLVIADCGKRVFKRLDELYANKGLVGFMAHQRVDAKLVLPEAVKMLGIKE